MKPRSNAWEMNGARVCVLTVLLLAALPTGAGEASGIWPFWDGSESIEQYARRAGLPAAKSLDLGNGVTLDLVLIPAGRFVMGTPEPQREVYTHVGFRAVGEVSSTPEVVSVGGRP